jgi:hypothetical protein
MSYQIANAERRFAYDVWIWFGANFLRQDARAVNSLYALLRKSRYNRSMVPEQLAGEHARIHQEILNAGELITDGAKRTHYLDAFADDDVLKEEVRVLERDDGLTYERAVDRMQTIIRCLILKGALPHPREKVSSNKTASINANTAGQAVTLCDLCNSAGRTNMARTHAVAKCRHNPESRNYRYCNRCDKSGHNDQNCRKRKADRNSTDFANKAHKSDQDNLDHGNSESS